MQIGIIGCGWAGSMRAAAATRAPAFRLVAVADQDPIRCRSLAEAYGAKAETDWKSLIARDDLEAVVISTPPQHHAEMSVAAMQASKHVLCEKPLARNPAECQRILDAAQASKRILATGFNYRFYPAIIKARDILELGEIGDLRYIRSFAGHPGGSEFTHPWVHDVDVMGGGALLDNGIHIIDLTRHFLNEVSEVKGYATNGIWRFPGCEDNGFALLKSPDGKVAILQASWTEWRGYRFWIEIYGTRGCVRAAYPPMVTQVFRTNGSKQRPQRKIHFFPVFQLLERLRSYRWTLLQSFTKEFLAFEQTIQGKKTPLALAVDGLRSVQIAHAVYQSSHTGKTVIIEN